MNGTNDNAVEFDLTVKGRRAMDAHLKAEKAKGLRVVVSTRLSKGKATVTSFPKQGEQHAVRMTRD